MRHITKEEDSEIIAQHLTYTVGGNNTLLRDALLVEQHKLCAYTETYLGRTDQKDIDHFNPLLKGTDDDGYRNWYLCKALWNREKSDKWAKFQPVMHPTDSTLEERIFYHDGNYILTNEGDKEAENLIKLLKLDDPDLASDRKKYIARLQLDIERYGETAQVHLQNLEQTNPERIYFVRAIQEVLGIAIF